MSEPPVRPVAEPALPAGQAGEDADPGARAPATRYGCVTRAVTAPRRRTAAATAGSTLERAH